AAARAAEFAAEFAPRTPYRRWLVAQVALATVRIDRCAALADHDAARRAERAALCWDEDRRAEAEHLARRLASDPPRLAPALRRTRRGVEWMIGRWEALAEAADRGGWDDERFSLAHDLLGLPEELRDVWPELPSGAPAEVQAEVAAAQLA